MQFHLARGTASRLAALVLSFVLFSLAATEGVHSHASSAQQPCAVCSATRQTPLGNPVPECRGADEGAQALVIGPGSPRPLSCVSSLHRGRSPPSA